MVKLPTKCRLITFRDEPNEDDVICKFNQLGGVVAWSSAVGLQGQEEQGKIGVVGHTQLGELVL